MIKKILAALAILLAIQFICPYKNSLASYEFASYTDRAAYTYSNVQTNSSLVFKKVNQTYKIGVTKKSVGNNRYTGGTAFAVGPYTLITNKHAIDNDDTHGVNINQTVIIIKGQIYTIKKVKLLPGKDIAIIKTNKKLKSYYKMPKHVNIKANDKVTAYGYQYPNRDFTRLDLYKSTGNFLGLSDGYMVNHLIFRGGMSGGPVFKGSQLIGVNSFGTNTQGINANYLSKKELSGGTFFNDETLKQIKNF